MQSSTAINARLQVYFLKTCAHAGTTEQFHENGYFADPQTINELAQYWEDQRNIDSLLGNVQEQQGADEVLVQHGAAACSTQEAVDGHAVQQPSQNRLLNHQPVLALQQVSENKDTSRVTETQVAVDETHVNPLGNLLNYSSSDDDQRDIQSESRP